MEYFFKFTLVRERFRKCDRQPHWSTEKSLISGGCFGTITRLLTSHGSSIGILAVLIFVPIGKSPLL